MFFYCTMDKQYLGFKYQLSEMEHRYGKNIHILQDPMAFTLLAQLCTPEAKHPQVYPLIQRLYQILLHAVVNQEFPRKPTRVATRMAAKHPREGAFTAELLDQEPQTVVVDLARAGTFPAHTCFETLQYLLNPQHIRQDHLMMSRTTNEAHQVTGAHSGGLKIGGSVENAYVLLPDPMAATGSTMVEVLDLYKAGFGNSRAGKAKKYIALHLIVTPEYLKKVQAHHSDLQVYALRLDRGLSPPDILSSKLGERWEFEKGLNGEQYIVPGGGGFGEILNNTDV
jgi:uracil phosphoribosyltransferase